MRKSSRRTRVIRAMMAIAIGGSAFQAGGCDATVRNTLLAGLQSTTTTLTTALIQAFFLTLQDDTTSTPTL